MQNASRFTQPMLDAERRLSIFEAIFRQSGDALVILDQNGFLDCNDAALAMFGYSEKNEFLKLHPRDLSPEFQPDGRRSYEASEAAMQQAFQSGHRLLEWQHIKHDGTPFLVEVMLIGIELETRPTLVVILRDISARKEAERRIATQQAALHQAEKMAALGSLLAGVAHELNNPLSVVLAQANLLQETSTEPRVVGRAEKIAAAAGRCARIVRSFLGMARQSPPTRKSVNLREVVQAALDLTAYGLRSNGVDVTLAIDADMPDVMGDPDRLGQLAMNLVINAQQALQLSNTPRRLAISGGRHGDEVRLIFADNGPGVPEPIRTRIFDPFFTTKPSGSGTGIGLSLCLSIVQAHGGSLACEETPGGGASFVVTLPTSGPQHEAIPDNSKTAGMRTAGRVLVVDDEPEIVEALREIISPLVSHFDSAATGADALSHIETFSYDLLLTDLRMPELDGRGLHARLQKLGSGVPRHIVFMTGDALDGNLRQFIRDTGITVLEKPFTAPEVREVVIRALASQTG